VLDILAAAGEGAEANAWGMGPGSFVALAMICVFALMLWAGVPRIIAGMLDERIAGIRTQLDEAKVLRAEAEALRHEYADKIANAEKDAATLLDHARHEADAIVARAEDDAGALIARREKMAEEKIAAAERSAVAELRAKAAEAAAVAARGLIAQNHGAEADKPLVDQAIGSI
jgi:F-type H+-transporting ATPase subunit b